MKTGSKLLMLTAATFISGNIAFAQTTPDPTPVDPPAFIQIIEDLFAENANPTRDDIEAALTDAGLNVRRLRVDETGGDVRIRAVTEDGERVRIRVDDGQVRIRIGDDTSDANGDDTSDTSDSNGDNSDGSSDSNGGDSGGSGGGNGGGNGGNGGGSDD